MPVVLSGVVGHIKWHFYTAGAINGYQVTRSKNGKEWSLTATVVLHDAFNMTQQPLTFVAKHKKGEWRWPILSLTWGPLPYQLSAKLGPPIEKVN